jgi:DNA-binding PadR family transcriptional regulator
MYQITRREEQVLISVWQLRESAYLVAIRKHLSAKTERDWSIGSVHKPLAKLEECDYLASYDGESTPFRGGRRKKLYSLTQNGLDALIHYKKVNDSLWLNFEGLEISK